MKRLCIKLIFYGVLALSLTPFSFGPPLAMGQDINDQNMQIAFEVHAPWNILDGKAESISGNIALADADNPDGLRAEVTVQEIQYKAGLSVAGRLVAAWVRLNSPTPAKFIIAKSALRCEPGLHSAQRQCTGSVDGQLNIWAKDYNIDVPVEIKPSNEGVLLTGAKEIKWGEYGFGDPDSTISNLSPVIKLNFSVELNSDNL